MNMYSLIQYYIRVNDLEKAKLCCEFLAKFDQSHYNHFVWLARINKSLENKEAAIENYKKALEICDRDKKWPRDSMEKLKSAIQKEMQILV